MAHNDGEAPDNELLKNDDGELAVDYRNNYFQEDVSWLHEVGFASNDDGVPGFMDGTVFGDGWKVFADLSKGDTLSAITGGIATGVTVADAIVDPFAFVAEQIVDWMLTHVEPLREWLDELAGAPDMVQAYADSWTKIAEKLVETSKSWETGLAKDVSTWTGGAGDAYKATANTLIAKISGAGGVAASMGKIMEIVQKVIDAFRTLVQDVLASLAGALIGWTLELIVTAGAAMVHVAPAAAARLARDTVKVSMLITKMLAALKDIGPYKDALTAVLTGIAEDQAKQQQEQQQQQPQPA
ncbi:hypothetical protein AB0H76_29020 [Nocardia sp. NPDC050712]|uniref:hypothetical protein n=1 Tax=Nocardia sp. NPDC050712 TaxID=3155518 RepID=UPI0033DEE1D3